MVGISSWFFTGFAGVIPGTLGTLAAIPFYVLMAIFFPYSQLWVLVPFLILALYASQRAAEIYKEPDPRKVVIDEVLGYFVTMFNLPFSITGTVLGFFLFRIFDILKPFPIRRTERFWGGIVWDDLLAGVYGNLVLKTFFSLGWIGQT